MSAHENTSTTTRSGALKRLALAASGVAGIGLVGKKAFADDDPANVAAEALRKQRRGRRLTRPLTGATPALPAHAMPGDARLQGVEPVAEPAGSR